MSKKFLTISAVFGLAYMAFAQNAKAQDARALLQKSSIAMGAENLNSILYVGTGHISVFGQNYLPNSPWPELTLTAASLTFDYADKSARQEITQTQDDPPSKGGGTPFGGEQKPISLVNGQYAWNQAGAQPQPQPGAAESRQLHIWLTPHGFVKAALEGSATMKKAKGGTEVTFKAMGKYKVVGVIDDRGLVTKVDTWMADPVLGDMLVESVYSDYKNFGSVKAPTRFVESQGGYPVFDLIMTDVKINPGPVATMVPDVVRQARVPPVKVETVKVGEGIWWVGGGSHHSVVVEFNNYIVVVETPLTEERAEAVLAEARKLVPNKPIKYVVNTHHHFDHSGGLRTVVAEGIPIITNEQNKAFYERVWKNPHTLEPDKLSKEPKKATFIRVKDRYTLTDGTQTLELYLTQPNDHSGDMMIGYLPKQKVLIVADLYVPARQLTPVALNFANQLYDNLQRLKLDVATIAPLHGRVVPYSDMLKALGKG